MRSLALLLLRRQEFMRPKTSPRRNSLLSYDRPPAPRERLPLAVLAELAVAVFVVVFVINALFVPPRVAAPTPEVASATPIATRDDAQEIATLLDTHIEELQLLRGQILGTPVPQP